LFGISVNKYLETFELPVISLKSLVMDDGTQGGDSWELINGIVFYVTYIPS
jgi:hypothetical protein